MRMFIENFVPWLATSTVLAIIWLLRMVLTNNKRISLLEAEIKGREEMRVRDREDIRELKTDVKLLLSERGAK